MARSNLRRAKGQTVAISALVLIAAMMLNLWLMLATDYGENFVRCHEKANAEHVTVAVSGTDDEIKNFLAQTLDSEPNVSEYIMNDCFNMTCTFDYNGGEMNGWFVFMNEQTALSRSVGKVEITENGGAQSGVYLPMIYETGDIRAGGTIDINIGSNTVTYNVCGFFNSVMMGSHNCGLVQVILTQDKYDELSELGYAFGATLCSVRLKDISVNADYEAELKSKISERFNNIMINGNCYDLVRQSRYIAQMICSGVISTMALLVLMIALVVIASNIVNYIQVNMKNLGALKAVGYTSGQLVRTLLLQFTGLSMLAALAGAGLSYLLFPAVNDMMISQTGIPYAVRFLPLPLFAAVAISACAVSLSVWLSARKIKKIEPITALRSGVQAQTLKRNHIPLDKAKVPLNAALALKTALSGIKHNVTVCVTVLVLSLVVVFSGLMAENVIGDFTPFLNLIVGETADSCINVEASAEQEFLQQMRSDDRVEKIYLFHSLNVVHAGGAELMATMYDDFSELNNKSVVYEGRFPERTDEIAVAGKYAGENDLKIGDEISITANGKTEKYVICGYTQISNYLGRDCLLTRKGYERLGSIISASYYINLANGVDIDEFNAEAKEKFAGKISTAVNIKTVMEGAAKVYVTLMKIIVIAILILSALIIAFVLYLLVRTMLNNKKRDYGILKSLGFTSGQLVMQTALAFMPAVILSTVAGLILGSIVINPLMSLFLSGIGIVKCTFTVPAGFVTAAGAGIIALSFAIACLLSLKVKKIAPCALLRGE